MKSILITCASCVVGFISLFVWVSHLKIFPEPATPFMFAWTTVVWIWLIGKGFLALFGIKRDEWGEMIHPGKIIIGVGLWICGLCIASHNYNDDGMVLNSVMIGVLLLMVTVLLIITLMIIGTCILCVLEFLGIYRIGHPPKFLRAFGACWGTVDMNAPVKTKAVERESPEVFLSACQYNDNMIKVITNKRERMLTGVLQSHTANTITASVSPQLSKIVNVYDMNFERINSFNL